MMDRIPAFFASSCTVLKPSAWAVEARRGMRQNCQPSPQTTMRHIETKQYGHPH